MKLLHEERQDRQGWVSDVESDDMNILVQHDPRSIALRGAGQNPHALVFRHAARDEASSPRCVVEFLPWKDVSERSAYTLLNAVDVFGCLGLIDVDEGTLLRDAAHLQTYSYASSPVDTVWRLFVPERPSTEYMLSSFTRSIAQSGTDSDPTIIVPFPVPMTMMARMLLPMAARSTIHVHS